MSVEDNQPSLVDLHAMVMLPDADVEDLASALDDAVSWWVVDPTDGALLEASATADTRIAVALRRRPTNTARWKPFLRGLGVPLDASAAQENESVLVVVRTATDPGRTVIWCFGTASLVVPRDLVDSRFGLIVALNKHAAGAAIPSWRMLPPGVRRRGRVADPHARVRRITSTVRDGYRHSVVARSVAAAPVDGLRFDSVSDLLRGVVVRTEDELMPDLEGGCGLKLATYVAGWNDLAELADHLVGLRRRTDYMDEWDWVDHVVPVTPRAEAARVMAELGRLVVDNPDAPIDIVLPDWENEDAPAAELVFRMGHETAWSRPVEWEHLRRHLLHIAPGPIAALHRRVRIGPGPTPARDAPVHEIPLHELLTGDFRVGDDHYVIGDGELLQVRSDFIHRLDSAVADIALSSFPFPAYDGGTEPEYLRRAPERSRHRLALLDDTPVRLPDETPFEACDLATDDDRLVFAKQKGRSSTFSHLCTQAETAAEMFARSPLAREALFSRMVDRAGSTAMEEAALRVYDALDEHRNDAVTITLVLLGPWRRRALITLPLVSRIRLRRTALRVTALGYRFEVALPIPADGVVPPPRRSTRRTSGVRTG